MSNNSLVIHAFFKHFDEFMEDIIRVYPENKKYLKLKMYFEGLKKANPRILIMAWKNMITEPYRAQIEAGDVNFFVEKDYTEDVDWVNKKHNADDSIAEMRASVRNMGSENTEKAMTYVQNLSKIGDLYN
jgi:hypothetical protein